MTALSGILLASFTAPMRIDTDPASILWLLPLVAAIAVVYKATKVRKIRARPFIRESAVLSGSILVFIAVAAVILYILGWAVTELLPNLFG
jgi:hypothetical protein